MKYWIIIALLIIIPISGCIDEIKAQNRFCYNDVEMFVPEKYSEDGMCYDDNNEILFSIFNRGKQKIEQIKYVIKDADKTVNMTSTIKLPYNQLKVIGVKANFNPDTRKTIYITPIVFYNITNSTIECTSRRIVIDNIEKC